MKLPVLSSRERETALCTYCPKLCRPACPVSTVEGRETVTPWGKMRAMGEILREVAPPDEGHFAPAYACTGCMRCRTLCALDNPVADTLRDGRAAAFDRGAAPDAARSVVASFARRRTVLERAARGIARRGSRVALFPGCRLALTRRGSLGSLARAVSAVAGETDVIADRCCGLPLLEAGDRAGFSAAAAALCETLAAYARIVVADPGCAHALRVLYPIVASGPELAIEHVSQTLAVGLEALPTLRDPPARVAYHDACRLGRGLNVYAEPRAVLARLLGTAPLELHARESSATCSGAGALLPQTRPGTAVAIARDLAAEAREVGAQTVVSACASSRALLRRAGIEAFDLSELVARAVAQRNGAASVPPGPARG